MLRAERACGGCCLVAAPKLTGFDKIWQRRPAAAKAVLFFIACPAAPEQRDKPWGVLPGISMSISHASIAKSWERKSEKLCIYKV
eukprot:scaffold4732_cov162-Pinguiococcus_pyrenoidosus.AAC.2